MGVVVHIPDEEKSQKEPWFSRHITPSYLSKVNTQTKMNHFHIEFIDLTDNTGQYY